MEKQIILNIDETLNENELWNTELLAKKINFFGEDMWIIRKKTNTVQQINKLAGK